MKLVRSEDVRSWFASGLPLSECMRSIGRKKADADYLDRVHGMPAHLAMAVERLREERGEAVPAGAFDSVPFHSLCRGLLLPLSGTAPERAAQWFGILVDRPPDTQARDDLVRQFLQKDLGLTLLQKLGCILGDPFQGRSSTFRRDSLLRLLMSVRLIKRRELLDRLAVVGDVAILFAESRPRLREEPPLTAAEVLESLRFLPDERRNARFDVLRSLLLRCGKLEAFYLAKLLLQKTGAGIDSQSPIIARSLAERFGTDEGQVTHAVALTDIFHVARLLSEEGPEALRRIQLQPLVAVRPALAGGTADEIKHYPVWVERKYDGIRLMLHKSSDARGSVLCGAYTRNRHDWLELVPGLAATIKMLPARNAILDGELYGTVLDESVVRPATVYEVHSSLQGNAACPVQMKFAAFDMIYLDGQDLTRLPLSERRQRLSLIIAPFASLPLPVPLTLAEGYLAQNKEDVNRLFHHFRAQGYEGIIAKNLAGLYQLGGRDASWMKRKPEITLDLVLLGAVLAVTTKEHAGQFGSYVIGARQTAGGFQDVGDVAGLDRVRDMELQSEILRDGLLTGRRIERPSASGVRPGFELRPAIVVTVKFEGITRDTTTRRLSLRDPKILAVRSDKSANDADTMEAMEEVYLHQRMA